MLQLEWSMYDPAIFDAWENSFRVRKSIKCKTKVNIVENTGSDAPLQYGKEGDTVDLGLGSFIWRMERRKQNVI